MTPYPKTPLRDDMLRDGRVRNLADMRWYDGYFSNVPTATMSAEELSFARWKIRREVIGMWRATKGDWKYFKGYTYLWEFGLRYIVWVNERLLELLSASSAATSCRCGTSCNSRLRASKSLATCALILIIRCMEQRTIPIETPAGRY